MLDKLERIWKGIVVIPLIYYSVPCVGPRGGTRKSHAEYLMFMLTFQNSSAFEQLQIAQSLALHKNKNKNKQKKKPTRISQF